MSAAPDTDRFRKFTCHEFERLVEAGVIAEDERVELLGGVLYQMPPQSPEHANSTQLISDLLRSVLPSGSQYRQHSPLVCGPQDEPEPDVAVLLDGTYLREHRHPRGDETLMVVEVSKTTIEDDRKKAAVYARGGVQVYWLVNLEAREVEIYEAPASGTYGRVTKVSGPAAEVWVPGTSITWTVDHILSAI